VITATQIIRVSLKLCFDHKMTLTFHLRMVVLIDLIVNDGQLYKIFDIDIRFVEQKKC
jgi:hypothetical protein